MAVERLDFSRMTEAKLREWVEANPGRVNDLDGSWKSPLYTATVFPQSLPLTLWLVEEKGADVNKRVFLEKTPILMARSADILNALLVRGADPTPLGEPWSPLFENVSWKNAGCVQRLLQDPLVKAAINMRPYYGRTALHFACNDKSPSVAVVQLLLQAGANRTCTDDEGLTPSSLLPPSAHIIKALLAQAPDGEKASILVLTRRLVVASYGNGVLSSYLQHRVANGQPLPHVSMTLDMVDHKDEDEGGRNFRNLLAFLVGKGGGPGSKDMPAGVFRIVLDLLIPSWDPRRKHGNGTQQLRECEIVGGMQRVSLQPE